MGEMSLYQNTGTPGVWDWRDVIYDAKRTRREVFSFRCKEYFCNNSLHEYQVHLADFTGDGKCDIVSCLSSAYKTRLTRPFKLLVDKATGATTVIRNDYDSATRKFVFTNIGVQTGAATCNEGYGYYKHDLGVQWHDMDGDGSSKSTPHAALMS